MTERLAIISLLLVKLALGQGTTVAPKTTVAPRTVVIAGSTSRSVVQAANHNITSSTTSVTIGNGVGSGWSSGNVGSGHLLYVVLIGPNPGTSTAADTLGTSFSCGNTTATTVDFGYCYGVTTASGADEITVTTSFNFGAPVLAFEIAGQIGAIDGSNNPNTGNSSASTSWTLGTVPSTGNTSTANDIIISCGGNDTSNATYTPGSGYAIPTNGQVSGSNQSAFCEYQFVSATGSYTPATTVSTSIAGSSLTIAFK